MKRILAVLFVLVIKSATAQVTAKAIITATIEYPVGTEELSTEGLSVVSPSKAQNEIGLFRVLTHQTTMVDIARFNIINATSLYSISVQSNTPRLYINSTLPFTSFSIEPMAKTVTQNAFTLNATINNNQLEKEKSYSDSFDVTVHFN